MTAAKNRIAPQAPQETADAAVRPLVRAGEVTIGQFRCAPDEKHFATAGAITRHCFVAPRRGVWIQHEDRPAFVADPTCITLYNPRQPYERRALDPAGDRSDWITVSDAIAREAVARHDPYAADSPRVFQFPYAPAPPDVYLAHRSLHEYVRRTSEPDLLFVEERAVRLLARTMAALYQPLERKRRADATVTARHRDTVEHARAYLNAAFRRNESLTVIAGAVGTSVFHLCRIFRRTTGLTLHAYRHHLRLRHALEPLQRPETDLLSVALGFGYSGHSHFTTAFRREFGMVPSAVRERIASPQLLLSATRR